LGKCSAYVSYNGLHYADPTGYSFWEKLKSWFVSLVIKTIVDIFLPDSTVKTDIPERSVQAGYEAYRAGQNPWRAAAIEAAVSYTEYAVAGATFGLTEDPVTAYRTGQAAGESVRQSLEKAWGEAQAVAQDLGVSAGRAADAVANALTSPQAATLGRSTAGTAMSRTIDLLSQYGRPLTGPELAGAAPGGLGLDVGLLKTRALRGFKGAGRPLAAFLTVNEVVNTYQNPLLNLEEQNQRAGIQVGALGLKLGFAGLLGLTLTGVGAPVAFGISVVGGGLISGIIDAGKEWELRRRGLSF